MQIEINRSEWMDNARRSPFASGSRPALSGGALAGYAVIAGLTAVFVLAGSFQSDQSGRVTAKTDISAEPADANPAVTNITLTKVISP